MRRLPRNIVKFLRRPRRNLEWEKALLDWIEAEESPQKHIDYKVDEKLQKAYKEKYQGV